MKKYILILLAAIAIPAADLTAGDNAVICLAKNIYHEARGESLKGKLAVAKVTLNRVEAAGFSNTVCGVVYEPKQFSWTSNRALKVLDKQAWAEALELAQHSIQTQLMYMNFDALYFHTVQMPKPSKWRVKKVAKIGNHVFYK